MNHKSIQIRKPAEWTPGRLHILVIMLYWYPYEGPLMPIYGAIFKDLMDKGHRITIVTSFPHFRKGRRETWREYRGKMYEITDWEGSELIRTWVFAPIFKKDALALPCRALNFISFNISSLLGALFLGGRPDVVFAPSSPPLTNGVISALVGFFKRRPVIYNVQDLYPDMALKIDLIRSRSAVFILRFIEKLVYAFSTKVLTISMSMGRLLRKREVPGEKIATIENFIDTDAITPGSVNNAFSRRYGLRDAFVVMYAGNVGIPHGVEVLVRAADALRFEEGITFCFVARGENASIVRDLAREKELTNTLFIPPQPRDMVPLIWASASAAVITYRKGLAEFSVPSKLFAAMCAARPVIASIDEDSEAARIIKSAKCGFVAPPEDETAISEIIRRLRRDPGSAREMGENGRQYVEKFYNKRDIVNRYEALLTSVAASRWGKIYTHNGRNQRF